MHAINYTSPYHIKHFIYSTNITLSYSTLSPSLSPSLLHSLSTIAADTCLLHVLNYLATLQCPSDLDDTAFTYFL